MKLSEILRSKADYLWKEASEKPFVVEMAKGTLDEDRFRYYMIQDYLYLQDYIGILQGTLDHTDDASLKEFLCSVMKETELETYRVHVPNMKKNGVTDEEIANCIQAKEAVEYVNYMRMQLDENGLLAGLTALLQCSWVYAYIGKVVTERFAEQIETSPYRSWFEAYECKAYIEANQKWIDVLDREAANITDEEAGKLSSIFETCAKYENLFWDMLYRGC